VAVTALGEIVGHASVAALLTAELVRPAQAYLFVGPANVGKATVARHFASGLLCPDGDSDCIRRVVHGIHPDLVLVEPEGRTAVTVEQARTTVALASLTPIEADRKVFLFEEAGLMNDEAANALLKTLEEPTASSVFLLVTDSEDDLPATVASRCRTVFFGRVGEEEIAAALAERGIEPGQAENAARISGGRPGLALALATRQEVADFRRVWLSVPIVITDQPGDAYRLADEVMAASDPLLEALKARHADELGGADDPGSRATKERHERELRRATAALHVTGLEILAGWYRDAAAAQLGAPVRNRDLPVTSLARVTPAVAVRRAQRVLDTITALEAHQRPQLAFADLFVDLGRET
jgi:DNA polymerase-3 subunit delta'